MITPAPSTADGFVVRLLDSGRAVAGDPDMAEDDNGDLDPGGFDAAF
jgi:hypothetical protein